MNRIFILLFAVVFIALPVVGQIDDDTYRSPQSKLFKEAETLAEGGNYSEAIAKVEQAIELLPEHPESQFDIEFRHSILSLANLRLMSYHHKLNHWRESIKYTLKVIDDRKKEKGEDESVCLMMEKIGMDYYYLGDGNNAVAYTEQALEMRKRLSGEKNKKYAMTLLNLGIYYSLLDDYANEIRVNKEAKEIILSREGKYCSSYAKTLSNMASANYKIGNIKEAIILEKESADIAKKIFGEESPQYANTLNGLAVFYTELKNYEEAERLCYQALDIRGKVQGKESSAYASSLHNLAGIHQRAGRIKESIDIYAQALEISKKLYGKEHPKYADILGSLAFSNYLNKDYLEAVRNASESLDIYGKTLGADNQKTQNIYGILAMSQFLLKNYVQAEKDLLHYIHSSQSKIFRTFADLSSRDRALFWKKYSFGFEILLPRICYYLHTPELVDATMNAVLLSKGLLLNADIEMQRLLMESDDQTVLDKYQHLIDLKGALNKQYEKPVNERALNCDSLEEVSRKMEDELIAQSKVYGDYTSNLRIKWQDVRKNLGKHDLAVEFKRFTINADSVMYIALVLTSDSKAPKMIPLFERQQLKAVSPDTYYTTGALTNLVWKPLETMLKDVKTIYFSPTGELYNIGIEYVPGMEPYKIYRLSSTRELAKKRETTGQGKVVLYGGIDYSLAQTERPEDQPIEMAFRDIPNLRSLRGAMESIPNLPGSRKEVQDISQLLTASHIPHVTEMDAQATEESFKALTGHKTAIIHFSTHGFYEQPDTTADRNNDTAEMEMNQLRGQSTEDLSLSRSGLLMAGAEIALSGEEMAEGQDDGILTAKEISRLDLRGLDLVVLSACETALGDVSGEGVFGLQRGFKKAGAQTLLMSLWKVDDTATQLLMTEFYRNLLSGQKKWFCINLGGNSIPISTRCTASWLLAPLAWLC
jgi:CHAT domain-containing protein/tetratricopeptide (TPR) repeat protein